MPLNNTRCGNPRLNKSQFVVRRVGFLLFRKGIYEHIFTLQVNFIVEGYKLRLYLHLHLKHISNSVKEMQSIKIQREIICISQKFFCVCHNPKMNNRYNSLPHRREGKRGCFAEDLVALYALFSLS